MDSFDQLDLIAEIAAALLGFIAIFVALSKTDGRFAKSDRHFIQALVFSASLAIILSIAPRTLSLFGDDSSVWFIATILGLFLGSLVIFLQVRLQLGMTPEEAAQIHWLWHAGAWFIGIACGILFILALVDPGRNIAFYVSGVTLLLPLSLFVFIGVVFRRFF